MLLELRGRCEPLPSNFVQNVGWSITLILSPGEILGFNGSVEGAVLLSFNRVPLIDSGRGGI